MKLGNFGITTEEINLKQIKQNTNKFNITPKYKKEIEKVNNNLYIVKLIFDIKNDEKTIFPFDMHMVLIGSFEIFEATDFEINTFLNLKAIDIMFPYLRAAVSGVTAASMLPPVMLPIVPSDKLFASDNDFATGEIIN